MNNVLETLYSLPFVAGLLAGIIGMKAWQYIQCRIADRRHPLPGGSHRHTPPISRVYVAGLLVIAVTGYVLLQTGQTERHYKSLAQNVANCQREFNEALRERAEISNQNDKLSIEQRDLLAKSLDAGSEWVNQLIILPPDLADLPRTSPRVEQYGIDVTRAYYDRIGRYRERINEISAEQQRLADQRAANPLPEPNCGK
ncbi:membrane protein [Mycobacterium phage PenguinLover67]|nr:membrane protein [Mycobacterium phage PenguinLover67]